MSAGADPVHTAAPSAQNPARLRRAQLARILLDIVFPPLCIVCRRPVAESHNLCAACWGTVSFLDGPECACCGMPFDFDPGARRHAL